ncbi:MAG: TVP38/TMEM64 family protein [Thermoanaerobaculia bacterium]
MEPAPVASGRRFFWIVFLLFVAGLAAWFSPLRQFVDPKSIAGWLRAAGGNWWTPLVFIVLYSVFDIFLIPATILSLTAGVVWGWLEGGLWVLLASSIGSLFPYLIGRSGAPWITARLERISGGVYEKLQHEGFITLLLLRLVPIFPYNVLNYAAGLAGIRPRDYILATFLGTIPGIFIFTYLADSIAAGVVSPREAFVRILLAGALLGGVAIIGRLFAGRVRSRLEQ